MAFWRPGQRESGAGADSEFVKGIEVKGKTQFFVASLLIVKNGKITVVLFV
jgi:hypothetical protein